MLPFAVEGARESPTGILPLVTVIVPGEIADCVTPDSCPEVDCELKPVEGVGVYELGFVVLNAIFALKPVCDPE
jgi:hypothetical protein